MHPLIVVYALTLVAELDSAALLALDPPAIPLEGERSTGPAGAVLGGRSEAVFAFPGVFRISVRIAHRRPPRLTSSTSKTCVQVSCLYPVSERSTSTSIQAISRPPNFSSSSTMLAGTARIARTV